MVFISFKMFLEIHYKIHFSLSVYKQYTKRQNKGTDRQTNRQADKQTNRQRDKYKNITNIQINRQIDKQTDRQTKRRYIERLWSFFKFLKSLSGPFLLKKFQNFCQIFSIILRPKNSKQPFSGKQQLFVLLQTHSMKHSGEQNNMPVF